MMDDLYLEAHKLIINMEVGQTIGPITCEKRSKNKIYLTNGITITFKPLKEGVFYLTTNKKVRSGRRSYDYIDTILRDVEGFLLYKIHSRA